MSDDRARATRLAGDLTTLGDSAGGSSEELFTLVYDELRRHAELLLRQERPGHTLQPTALVHEAYLKLVDTSRVDWQGRAHFFAVGARAMRRLLIDHARGRSREKRGRDWRRIEIDDRIEGGVGAELDLDQVLALDQALKRLAGLDRRQARIVELRFFAGLTVDEVALVLGVSSRTVKGEWAHARSWLKRELDRRRPR